MNISIFVICYNEEIILQKFINHYRTRFPNCEITIYDNMSTDNSRQIAIKNGCKVLEYDSNKKPCTFLKSLLNLASFFRKKN